MEKSFFNSKMILAVLTIFVFVFAIQMSEPAAAAKYKKNHKKCNFFFDIMLRPFWAFFKVYVLNLGFLDGKMGWILSTNHYFYTMNKYIKLYFLYQDKDGRL